MVGILAGLFLLRPDMKKEEEEEAMVPPPPNPIPLKKNTSKLVLASKYPDFICYQFFYQRGSASMRLNSIFVFCLMIVV